MQPDHDAQRVIEETSRAMQLGPAGESTILSLFADDAEWVEPYTGQRRTHSGKEAIRAALRQMWTQPSPPGFTITTDRMDVEGQSVKVEWTCSCEGVPKLMRGYSMYTISPEMLISKLELFITETSGEMVS
jgi:ketosteroid isomerase-like protein